MCRSPELPELMQHCRYRWRSLPAHSRWEYLEITQCHRRSITSLQSGKQADCQCNVCPHTSEGLPGRARVAEKPDSCGWASPTSPGRDFGCSAWLKFKQIGENACCSRADRRGQRPLLPLLTAAIPSRGGIVHLMSISPA